MANHCFISYSSTDAPGFAARIADALNKGRPAIPVWLDQRDIRRGVDWDAQINEALKACRAVLYLVTPDSSLHNSIPWQECTRALSYKKTVIPLLMKANVPIPSRLGKRQTIDFSDDFDLGIKRLRKYLAELKG